MEGLKMRFLTQRQSLLLTNAVDKFVEQVNSFYKGQPHLVSLIIMSVSNDDSFYLLQALKINPVISAAVQSARYNFNNPPIQIISNTNDVEIDEKSVIDEIKLMVLMRLNEHLSNSIKATCLQTDITENQK
ncbi:MAG: hypothetical protein HWD59_03630 [Coxiellaceae bacterium]|nr:MAG: hypothetical protein HWD59_03630 [Coxiellaceae bacterium]